MKIKRRKLVTNYHDMFSELRKRFYIHKKLFSSSECDIIVEHYKSQSYVNASVADLNASEGNKIVSIRDDEARKGRIVFCDHKNPTTNFAFQKLYYSLLWANFGWSVFPLRFLQIAEYNSATDGGFYKRHRDIIKHQTPQRIISSVTQLSRKEDYTGCNLIFDDDSGAPTDFLEQGDTIFFTSIEPHEVTPIMTGTRYSLTAWYEGPVLWESLPEDF